MAVTAEDIRALVFSADAWRRARGAGYRRCPADLLDRLVTADPDEHVRSVAAANPKLPAEARSRILTAAEASADPVHGYRPEMAVGSPARALYFTLTGLARNPAMTTGELRRLLALSSRSPFSQAVLTHPNCPSEFLARCAAASAPYLRALAATHPALDPGTARRLAADPFAKVRIGLLRNKEVSQALIDSRVPVENDIKVLQVLVTRCSDPVRQQAVDKLAARSRARASKWLVARTSRDPDQLTGLCLDSTAWVRRAAAGNPVTPEEAQVAAALLG